MRPLTLLALLVSPAAGWAPLDALGGLFGVAPLHDPASKGVAQMPLHGIEHEECHMTPSGCKPANGCKQTLEKCTPLVGHYWPRSEPKDEPTIANMLGPLASALTPSPPSRIMTEKGVMDVTPGFFYASYKLVDADEPAPPEWPLRLYKVALFAGIPLTLMVIMRALAS